MTHTYQLTGMTCSSCESKVKSKLLTLPDITSVEISKDTNSATIGMEKHISLTNLQEALGGSSSKYQISATQHNEIAEQTKNTASLELLEIWHHQIIEARIYKAENSIPDAANEMELAIADIETFVGKTEERQETLNDFSNPVKTPRPKVQEQDNDSQLSLF